ncbi:MAG: hypothetical protein D6714_05590 [Bacteroidetes bacterium]|nr:MAG: hypothetical protein D6714_05590 [Bacteroidota bacterium]
MEKNEWSGLPGAVATGFPLSAFAGAGLVGKRKRPFSNETRAKTNAECPHSKTPAGKRKRGNFFLPKKNPEPSTRKVRDSLSGR